MEWDYRGSFLRDWEKINEIERAPDSKHITHLKKLRIYETRYRIEIALSKKKIYWILCVIARNKIELVRLKPEVYFKKKL